MRKESAEAQAGDGQEPSGANGRPAVTAELRVADRGWLPQGISILDVESGVIAGIEAFLDPALLPRFGVPVGRGVR